MRKLINPKVENIPELKKLWCECFPDDANGYCDFFFEHYFKPEVCLVLHNGEEIESAAYMFDSYYKGPNYQKYDFMFLYAIGTLKKYRGKNNLKFMVEGCLEYAKEKGMSGINGVSVDDLTHIYDSYGCKRMAMLHTYTVEALPEAGVVSWQICPFEKFSLLRTAYLDEIGNCFYWRGDSEKYMYEDAFTRGSIIVCEYESRAYYAVCTRESDRYTIRETNFPLDKAYILVSSIADYYNYRGLIDIYSRYDSFVYPEKYSSEDIYYGHYGICQGFCGDENLSNAYINIVAD
jgi:hypothetical protein